MIEISNISKEFNKKRILESISFSLKKGKISALLGKNGSGKSTLFNIIAGQIIADKGDILFNEVSIFKNHFKENFDFLLDISPLNEDMTGMEFLKLKTMVYGVTPFPKEEAERLIFDFFEKQESIFLPIGEYSIGMKKKLEIISCLLSNAEVLILDEPTTGLDIGSVRKLNSILKQVKQDKFILYSSHDLYFIKESADSVIILKDGNISFNDSKDVFLSTINGNTMNEDNTIDNILSYF